MSLYRFLSIVMVTVVFAAAVDPLYGQSQQGANARMFGLGQPATVDELPPGQFKRKLIELPPQSRGRALKWLQGFEFPELDVESLDVDGEGNVFYVDRPLIESGDGAAASGPSLEAAPQSTLDDAFLLHSRPGAPNVVFIDFDGDVFSGTAWGGGATFRAKPYDLDGDPNTFNSTERGRIADIWHRVAEDLAPFDIDVTTEGPANFGPRVGHVLVTHTVDETGQNMPSNSGGGVAYVNVFGQSNYHTYYSPALVYYNHLGSGGETYVAEASSHEFGHNLGLSHDGTTTGTEYFQGLGGGLSSWAPIMGNSYYNNVTQWSRGEYPNANNTQDDRAIIDGKLTYAGDEVGNSNAAAAALFVAGDGSVVSSNPEFDPHNLLPENKGVIDDAADVDVFGFIAGSGTIDLTVTPAWDAFYRATDKRGANLDIRLELRNAANSLVAASDSAVDTSAAVSAAVSGGAYYLHVSGVGNPDTPYSDYASQGQYFINGFVPVGEPDTTPPSPNPMAFASPPVAAGTDAISMTAATATDDVSAVQYQFRCVAGGAGCASSSWQSSTGYTASGLAPATQYTFTVAARDQSGNQTQASAPASATTDEPPPYVNYVATGETVVVGSVSGSYTATHADDGNAQVVTERESGGKPSSRYTYLEHRWYFSIGSGATVTVVVNAWKSGPNASESFELEYSLNGGNSFQPLLNIDSEDDGNLQMALIPGAPSGAVVLRAVDTFQQSGNRDVGSLHVDQLYIQVGNPPSDPPDGAPQSLSATAVSSSAIDLGWTDASSNESGFLLERSPNGSSNWVEVANLPAGTESYGDSGLAAATQYFYRVSAWNPIGSTGYATANATTHTAPPPAPVTLQASGYKNKGIQHVLLQWSGASSVDIYRDGQQIASGVGGTSYDDNINLKGAGSYQHQVCVAGGTVSCSNTTTTVF